MHSRRNYALTAALLFVVEVFIATRLRHWPFVRGSLGDVLVVGLLYASALALRDLPRVPLACGAFAFACAIELCQYFHLAQVLGLQKGGILWVALGNTAQWEDIACYFVGALLSLLIDVSAAHLAATPR